MKIISISFGLIFALAAAASAQPTAFKYQGSLTDGGNAANGSFQMQFKLFDAVSGGAQIGSTLSDLPVTATNGVFSVSLDFGTSALNGANRWIEIAVRRNAGESYVTLSPRERISSAPYAVRTLSAAQADTALDSQKLGGVDANQFVQTNDARLSDARNPLAGSANYIQNSAGQQASSNFNISGNGTATSFNVNGPFSFGNVAAPPVAPAGQSRFYFDTATNKLRLSENGAAYVNLVGATGISGSGTVNRLPLFSAATTLGDSIISQVGGNIGIGTLTPGSGLELRGVGASTQQRITDNTSGNSLVLQGGAGGNMKVTGFNYGTGIAQPLYLSTDGANTLINSGGGNVGIRTTTPTHSLDVNGTIRAFSTSDSRISVETSGTNNLARLLLNSANRSWFLGTTQSFNNDEFYIGEGISGNKMTFANDGTVGIGKRPDPFFRLDATGPIRALSASAGHFVAETTGGDNTWARFYMRSPSQSWFIGTSQNFNGNQLYIGNETANQTPFVIATNGNVGINQTNPPTRLFVEGNAGQNLGGYGLPKAMAHITAAGAIFRCYNGLTGATHVTGNCGFSVSHTITGRYLLNFGFNLGDRLVSLTKLDDGCFGGTVSIEGADVSGTNLTVRTFCAVNIDSPFMVFVY